MSNSTLANNSNLGISSPNNGTVSVSASTFNNNGVAGCSVCAGISGSLGTLTVRDSTFTANNFGVLSGGLHSITLTGNSFTGNTAFPMSLNLFNATTLVLSNNSGANNAIPGVQVFGQLNGNATLPLDPGLSTYVLSSDLTINSGATLTLLPGTVIKGMVSTARLVATGTLSAQGTQQAPIYFTSTATMLLVATPTRTAVPRCPLPATGAASRSPPAGSATLTYAAIWYGGGTNNNNAGLSTSHPAATSVSQSSLANNSVYGMFNASLSPQAQAPNNWWGSPSGPAPNGTGNGINFQNCGASPCIFFVNAVPFLTASPF